jgi:flagellar protein FlaF
MSIQAYQRAQAAAETPRETEFRIFAAVTRLLQEAQAHGGRDAKSLIHAIHKNRELWFALSADCSSTDNRLPAALRAQIISLALFVDRHSSAILREGADLDVLIEINRSVMQGLAPQPAAAPAL